MVRKLHDSSSRGCTESSEYVKEKDPFDLFKIVVQNTMEHYVKGAFYLVLFNDLVAVYNSGIEICFTTTPPTIRMSGRAGLLYVETSEAIEACDSLRYHPSLRKIASSYSPPLELQHDWIYNELYPRLVRIREVIDL